MYVLNVWSMFLRCAIYVLRAMCINFYKNNDILLSLQAVLDDTQYTLTTQYA
jgi:hypothetical protein